jgi:glycosyltransferase involved in cell wall biosynthesis
VRKPVLTIFYQFNPWQATIGGIQSTITNFIKYAPSEFEVRLVGTAVDATQSIGQWHTQEFAGKPMSFFPLIRVENDDFRQKIPTTLRYALALLKRNFRSDFMHFHRLEPSLASLGWAGDKTLFVHNDIQEQVSATAQKNAILWQRFPALYFGLESLLVRQFSEILSCNTNSVQFYQQRYPTLADRIQPIKNTVDNEIFYPLSVLERMQHSSALAQKLGLATDTRFILFAGRLHPQKDPILLLRALAALQDPQTHLLIAGNGELASEVKTAIDHHRLAGQVTMLGSIGQRQLADLHRLSRAFVLSSAYEGLPMTVLEALACGTPVVTTHCGETPNLLTANSGVVSSERTPIAIADAMRQVLLNPEHYPASACVRAAKPYDARLVTEAVYDQMLSRWEPQPVLAPVHS